MSTTAALVEGHYITVRYPDAGCQCGVSFDWNDRDKAHALHLLDVARAEERERIAQDIEADLLDEATRLADRMEPKWPYDDDTRSDADTVRALVERVQQAEAGREQYSQLWQKASMSVLRLTDERDEARGKLDKVRALADEAPNNLLDELRTLLAILDGPARE